MQVYNLDHLDTYTLENYTKVYKIKYCTIINKNLLFAVLDNYLINLSENITNNNIDINNIINNHKKKLSSGFTSGTYYYFLYDRYNYYNLLYNTLPQLINYFELKKSIPDIKLLVNLNDVIEYEFFNFFNISDYCIHMKKNIYERVYISEPINYTSNPKLLCDFYNTMKYINNQANNFNLNHKKIYIKSDDRIFNNKIINEPNIIEFVQKHDYHVINIDVLRLSEKINVFENATHIISTFSNQLANLVFSNPTIKLLYIVDLCISPDDNNKHILANHNNITYFDDCPNVKVNIYVRIINPKSYYFNKIGFVIDYSEILGLYRISFPNNSKLTKSTHIIGSFKENEFEQTNKYINSFVINADKFFVMFNEFNK